MIRRFMKIAMFGAFGMVALQSPSQAAATLYTETTTIVSGSVGGTTLTNTPLVFELLSSATPSTGTLSVFGYVDVVGTVMVSVGGSPFYQLTGYTSSYFNTSTNAWTAVSSSAGDLFGFGWLNLTSLALPNQDRSVEGVFDFTVANKTTPYWEGGAVLGNFDTLSAFSFHNYTHTGSEVGTPYLKTPETLTLKTGPSTSETVTVNSFGSSATFTIPEPTSLGLVSGVLPILLAARSRLALRRRRQA